MTSRDFELAMKLKADFGNAQRDAVQTKADIEGITDAAQSANAALSKEGAGAGQSSRVREMVQRSLAELEAARAQLDAESAGGTDQRAAATAKLTQAQQAQAVAMRATQQAVAAEIGLIGDLQTRLGRTATSTQDLADTEARLDAAMSKGLISADEYEDALGKLAKQQDQLDAAAGKSDKSLATTISRYDKAGAGLQRLAADEARLKQAVDSGRLSREQYNKAMSSLGAERARLTDMRTGAERATTSLRKLNLQSAETQRNLSQLVSYGVTGNWQLAGNQIMQLGNQVGIAGALFSTAGIAIAGVVAVVGAVGAVAAAGYLQMRALDTALIATGHDAGVSAGQLGDMRNEIGAATGQYGDAQAALVALASSGRIAGDSLEAAAGAAVNLSELTGRSIEDTTNQVIALAKSPTATLLELNSQYHFLSLSVYENVKSLEDQGRAQEAAQVATNELARVTSSRVSEMRANAGSLERSWYDVRDAVRSAIQAAKDYFDSSIEGQLRVAKADLDLSTWASDGAETDRIKGLRERIALLGKQKAAQDESNRSQADEQKLQDRAVEAARNVDRDIAKIDKKVERQQRLNKLIEDYNAISLANPGDKRLYDGSYDRLKKQIERETAGDRGRSDRKRGAQTSDDAARKELDNLAKQAALLGEVGEGESKATEAARIRYEVTEGAYRTVSPALKEQLEDYAQLLDSERGLREERVKQKKGFEDAKRAYEQLLDALRTPAEAALETAIERITTLNSALKSGLTDAQSYSDNVGKVLGAAFAQAPKFNGLAPEVGGANSEQTRLNAARTELEKWYADQMALLNQFRAKKAGAESQWNAQEVALAQQHQQSLLALQQAQTQLTLTQAEGAFGSLADIAKAYGGEQSQTYRALFAVSKGFAVAQAAVALAQNVAEASKLGFPANIPMIAGALAQGAQIAALLSAANYSSAYASGGHVRGPGTGTSDSIRARLSDYEYVTRAAVVRQPGALPFLEDFNERGMSALYAWTEGAQFAAGGLAAADRPSRATPWTDVERNQQAAVPSLDNRMRVYVLQNEEQLVDRLLKHPKTEKAIVVTAGANGAAIRAEW